MRKVKIAVSGIPYSADRPYSYCVPDSLVDNVTPGLRVMVPFGRGNHLREGIVLSEETNTEDCPLKEISSLLENSPVITAEQIKLAIWMRERFFCTAYEAFRSMLPPGLWFRDGRPAIKDKTVLFAELSIPVEEAWTLCEQKRVKSPKQSSVLNILIQIPSASVTEVLQYAGAGRSSLDSLVKQGIIRLVNKEVFRRPEVRIYEKKQFVLSNEQQKVFEGLCQLLKHNEPQAALLYGITGSGKTNIYIRLIEHCLKASQGVILMVPEIALTPQLVSVFTSYFGSRVALVHSSLSMGERYDEWKRIRDGAADVVIGTRSAVFAPVTNLGMIIIDEEHELSYKSESAPRYHVRDIAKYRCNANRALLLMGSATPSIESMYRAVQGIYRLFTLKNRYNQRGLPSVIPVDMRNQLRNGKKSEISSVLAAELQENITQGKQSILLLNRRGASSSVICSNCGFGFVCPRCSVNLVYHSANHRLMCHYCGYSQAGSSSCPDCGGELQFLGTGTQRVEEELSELFPGVGIVRMDSDTVSLSGSHDRLLSKFKDNKVPILLGTQMIAKGLDFSDVTLVGVLNADNSLFVSDYRARERTFSLITQVVGRAGRGESKGRAVIQSFSPNNEIIRFASDQNYDSFYESEISVRKELQLPPFCTLFSITFSGDNEAAVLHACTMAVSVLRTAFQGRDSRILGPAPSPILRVNNSYHYKVTIYCEGTKADRRIIGHAMNTIAKESPMRRIIMFADSEN